MTPPTPPGPPAVPPSGPPPGSSAPAPPPRPKARRGRPRLKPLRERNPIPIALLGVAVLVLGLLVALRADELPIIGGGTTYQAYFSEAAGLKGGQEVRVAGVKVGKVTGVELAGNKVRVSFRVRRTWVGDASRATIMIKTLLGSKYLALDPLGAREQDPGTVIPLDRTVSPYDVTTAFQDLGRTFQQVDTGKLAASLQTISASFEHTPASVRLALDGLSSLSHTIASRDAELAQLLAGTKRLSGTLADQNEQFEVLFKDGNLLLGELRRRREAIHTLLVGTERLAKELVGLVRDLQPRLQPTLDSLSKVTAVLQRNQKSLDKALSLAGPYIRMTGNAVGSGRWVDGYLCGTVPLEYLEGGSWKPSGPACEPPHLTGGR
ncbi:MCE family protein [Spirillospora sp. NBC_01491]|uniref:MCE family protein n=1 Tax=Spirillospora sp. NBC_01491 TaxID=2976007 RepID=UPI002E319747|nr:MCE family protein [Spirillospora sp. NBC_01491]